MKKTDQKASERNRIKEIAAQLLETLKAEKLKIDHWRDKEAIRDAVRITILDFLWNDETGLPTNSYTDVGVKRLKMYLGMSNGHIQPCHHPIILTLSN